VLLVALDAGTEVAGVLTRSRCPSAPVEWCRTRLADGFARGLLVNSGNANAFTGMAGREAVRISTEHAATALGCAPEEVLIASTGVLGEPLPPEKFSGVLGDAAGHLAPGRWLDAARAIMTTDTYPKLAGRRARLGGVEVNVAGIAKGAG